MAPVFVSSDEGHSPEKIAGSVPKARRYYVFCDSPDRLQDLLDDLQFYDFKDTIVIPPTASDAKPVVCVVMEDPDERTRVALERVKEQSKSAAHKFLRTTSALLEEWSERLK